MSGSYRRWGILFALLDGTLSALQLVGGALVISGVLLVTVKRS